MDEDGARKTARLAALWGFLHNEPFCYTTKDLAGKFGVTVRTIYRDLEALDVEVRLPVEKRGTRWGIGKGDQLPPVRLTLGEALTIFLAARLAVSHSHRYDPRVDSAFTKLGGVVPLPLREEVQRTLAWMRKLPRDDLRAWNLARMAEAWVARKAVRIRYRSQEARSAEYRVIEPYFIEPAAPGHSSYVIARCRKAGGLRVFKVERIEGIEVTDEKYAIPAGFDANEYLSAAWGITVEGERRAVRLKCGPAIVRLMEETIWHPSQVVSRQADGSAIMSVTVFNTPELVTWILGWGEKMEVLEPADLRAEVARAARAMAGVYGKA